MFSGRPSTMPPQIAPRRRSPAGGRRRAVNLLAPDGFQRGGDAEQQVRDRDADGLVAQVEPGNGAGAGGRAAAKSSGVAQIMATGRRWPPRRPAAPWRRRTRRKDLLRLGQDGAGLVGLAQHRQRGDQPRPVLDRAALGWPAARPARRPCRGSSPRGLPRSCRRRPRYRRRWVRGPRAGCSSRRRASPRPRSGRGPARHGCRPARCRPGRARGGRRCRGGRSRRRAGQDSSARRGSDRRAR